MDITNQLQYRIIQATAHMLGVLPAQIRNTAAVVLGRIVFAADAKHRRIAIENLTRAFGNEKSAAQIRSIAIKVFENMFRILFEVGWSLRLREDQFRKYFTGEAWTP